MRRLVGIWRELALLGIAFCCACDGSKPAPGVSETWDNVCVDMDKDGYGFQCEGGSDCDDANKAVHDDCSSCRTPSEGCECEDGIEPIDCRLPYTMDTSGSLLCHTGTRYCRDGAWSGCEGVITFTVPPPARQLTSSSLLDPAAPAEKCNPKCDPGCYLIEDKLDTPFEPDAGVGSNVVYGDAGGVTVRLLSPISTFPEVLDGTSCDADAAVPDPDCDGLPAPYDPDALPSGGSHKVAFFDLAPGTARAKTFQAKASADALDVYLYPGIGTGMELALPELASAFTSGSFLPDEADITCLDLDGDAMPDDNKAGGIAGNVSCLVRDVRFGTGWFHDIPFFGPIAQTGLPVASWDTDLFEHHHDISADRASVRAKLASFQVLPSLNRPEAATQGLWSIATGEGFYTGWDRPAIPGRADCKATEFGYPCFRQEALPVVLLISPAPMQNGPMTPGRTETDPVTPAGCLEDAVDVGAGTVCAPLDYPSDLLDDLRPTTDGVYRTLSTSADTVTDPQPVGVIDDVLVTYVGRVDTLKADYDYTKLSLGSCYAWNHEDERGHDAVFSFHVDTPDNYLFSGRGSRFDNTLSLFSADTTGIQAFVACSDDNVTWESGGTSQAPEIRADLEAGDYLLVMKAFDNRYNQGEFQVSLGRTSLENPMQPVSFEAKRWSGTKGVQEALTSHGVRVATLQVAADPYLRAQAEAVAQATGAIDAAGLALRGDLAVNKLGDEAVRVLRAIVGGTKYDVSLELPKIGAADGQNPGFGVVVEAIDSGSCEGGVRDTDADGIPDTHLGCVASAKPPFRVTFSNPAGASAIPKNPADTVNGGYWMWMRVLGDKHVVLDRLRVYAVPEQVYTPIASTKYNPTGTYEQEVRSNDCAQDELPAWEALTWKVGLPPNTSIRFEACGGDTSEELSSCALKELVSLTPGAMGCTPGDACGDDGYCDVNGSCVQIQGASCAENEDCGAFGVCAGVVGAKHCANTVAALDTFPVARTTLQGKRFVRVVARLNSSPDSTQAPTLLQWSINYRCVPRG